MDFTPLSEAELEQLDALKNWQRTLARAELSEMLAEIRLAFNDQALKEIANDPWFRDQERTVQVAIQSALATARAEELVRLGDALVWLRRTPQMIEDTRQFFNGKRVEEANHG